MTGTSATRPLDGTGRPRTVGSQATGGRAAAPGDRLARQRPRERDRELDGPGVERVGQARLDLGPASGPGGGQLAGHFAPQ